MVGPREASPGKPERMAMGSRGYAALATDGCMDERHLCVRNLTGDAIVKLKIPKTATLLDVYQQLVKHMRILPGKRIELLDGGNILDESRWSNIGQGPGNDPGENALEITCVTLAAGAGQAALSLSRAISDARAVEPMCVKDVSCLSAVSSLEFFLQRLQPRPGSCQTDHSSADVKVCRFFQPATGWSELASKSADVKVWR